MWRCECGCQSIAASLSRCPMCGKERQMPTITSGGPSNAWEPAEAVEPTPEAVADESVAKPVSPTPAKKQARSTPGRAEK